MNECWSFVAPLVLPHKKVQIISQIFIFRNCITDIFKTCSCSVQQILKLFVVLFVLFLRQCQRCPQSIEFHFLQQACIHRKNRRIHLSCFQTCLLMDLKETSTSIIAWKCFHLQFVWLMTDMCTFGAMSLQEMNDKPSSTSSTSSCTGSIVKKPVSGPYWKPSSIFLAEASWNNGTMLSDMKNRATRELQSDNSTQGAGEIFQGF